MMSSGQRTGIEAKPTSGEGGKVSHGPRLPNIKLDICPDMNVTDVRGSNFGRLPSTVVF